MKTKELGLSLSVTSPATASTVASASPNTFKLGYLSKGNILVVDAILTGATGGALDVYLQRRTGADDWTDWVHFPQVTAAQAATRYTFGCDGSGTTTIQAVGGGTTAAPGVFLAANTYTNVMPGNRTEDGGAEVRFVFVAGASTSAGAPQKVTISPYTEAF